ncbi:MAG: flippase [Candidatus Magasanikbacteria bacterium]
MSLTRQVAHNTIYQLVGKVISTFFGLLAIGMMTRYLGTEQFGWYITVITFLQFIGILIDFGLIPVTAQMMSEPNFDKQFLFKNLLTYRLVTALIFLGITPFVAWFFPYPLEVKIAISFTTISFLCISINQVITGLFQSRLKMHIQTIAENIGRIALVAGLYLVITKGLGFLPIMGIVTLASMVYTLALLIFTHRETPLGFAYDKQIWKSITHKMWPITISIIFNVVYLKGDTLILTVMRSQAEVGMYGAAYRVIDIIAQMAMMIMGVMLPLLAYSWSRNHREDFRHRYQMSFDSMMLIAIPTTVGMAILSTKIMRLVAGNNFTDAGNILQILSLAVLGVFVGGVFGHVAVAINRQKQTMWIYISDAIITLIGYLIFIPRYGLSGAAWMTVFSEWYAGLLLFITIKYYSKEQVQLKTFVKIALASIAMGSVLFLLQNLHVLTLILIGILVYGLVLVGIGGISKKTLKEILTLHG